jgi:hypothetical protein
MVVENKNQKIENFLLLANKALTTNTPPTFL